MKLPHLTWARAGFPTPRSGCGLRACRPHPLPGVGPQVSLLMLYPPRQLCKKDDFNLDIVNFPYMCSNIPAKPTYGVYISQLIRICRICDNYSSFLLRHKLLTERLVRQGFWYNKLCITFKKFARRYNVLISKYGVSVRAHVTEGICIPLVAKPDLIRNVTIRVVGGCGSGRST